MPESEWFRNTRGPEHNLSNYSRHPTRDTWLCVIGSLLIGGVLSKIL